jgi:hypothetical protein
MKNNSRDKIKFQYQKAISIIIYQSIHGSLQLINFMYDTD